MKEIAPSSKNHNQKRNCQANQPAQPMMLLGLFLQNKIPLLLKITMTNSLADFILIVEIFLHSPLLNQ